jgi:3-isopropylmalate/(R)-2-methylmalate dehydratase small subunit
MESFTVHTGTAMPLRRSNVDTDQISPARFVPYFAKTGYTNILFADWRDDPSFVLNRPQHQGATILVAGNDFGTGSSRESAVWALQAAGFRAVIAPRYGDIFRGNSLTKGLLTVIVPAGVVARLWELIDQDASLAITVDLRLREVRYAGEAVPFKLDDAVRARLLSGADLISDTLRHEQDIARFEGARRPGLPTTVG